MKVFTQQGPCAKNMMRFGPGPFFSATNIEEYERVDIGKGHFGLLVKNPTKGLWHLFEEECGALIGTHENKAMVYGNVCADVAGGDEKLMNEQVKQGLISRDAATEEKPAEFFSAFAKGRR